MHRVSLVVCGMLLVSASARADPCADFTDVEDTSAFCESVEWVKNRGITLGVTPTLYGPNAAVTRLQMAAFLYRLGGVTFQQGGNAFDAPARLGTKDFRAVEILAYGTPALRVLPGVGSPIVVGGNAANDGRSPGAAIGGGGTSVAPNRVLGEFGTVAGGLGNTAGGVWYDTGATVGGGENNAAPALAATIAGGLNNVASEWWTTVAGGHSNTARGRSATVIGGFGNVAAGQVSIAGGYKAYANHDGCIVLADASTSQPTSCFANNEIVIRGRGGFYFWTSGFSDETYSGARLAPGTGAWAAYSDVQGKHALDRVDAAAVLGKLVAMPISTWQWKSEPGVVRHMGPTAQDFRAAFGLGDSDRQIVTIDADGVALAAIQGLNAKLEAKLAEKDAELDAVRALLAKLGDMLAARPNLRLQ